MTDREILALCEKESECYVGEIAAEKVLAFAHALIATVELDAKRYRWLRAEHDIFNPVARVVWKQRFDRTSSDWCETVNSEYLDRDIDSIIEEIE